MQPAQVLGSLDINSAPPPTAPPVRPAVQLDHVDGLRGFLTLSILIAHVRTSLIYVPLHAINTNFLMAITMWIWPSFYTVGMFVAISGYCLMLPVARSQNGTFRGGVNDYLRRRSRRILPPYYAALLLYIVASYLVPSDRYLRYDLAMTPGSLVTHGLLIHNLFQQYRFSIDASSWTVGSEWELYLLFPFILLPVWRRFGISALLAVAAILSAIPVLFQGDALNWHSWYILIFALGMCGAAIQHYHRPQERRIRDMIPWRTAALLLLGAFALICIVDLTRHQSLRWEIIPDWKRFCFYEILSGAGCVALMVHLGQRQASAIKQGGSLAMKFLTQRWLTLIGMFSYSHYLLHWPLLISVRWLTLVTKMASPYVILTMYFVAPAVTLSVGYLFFLLVERRCLPTHLRKPSAASVNAPQTSQ